MMDAMTPEMLIPDPSAPARDEVASAPFAAVVATAEAVEATASRLAKADALAPLLRSLSDPDLVLAARWLSGRLFPAFDPRTSGTGHALLLAAIARASGREIEALRPRLVTLGDAGEVAADALAGRSAVPATARGLTIADVGAAFDALADVTGTKAREAAVAALLVRLSAREARLAVRLLAGDPRIGLREGGVEEALARVFARDGADVRRAAMLGGDLGETARLARADRLAEARLRLLHPLRFMLATAADSPEEVARRMPGGFAVEDKYDGIRAQLHVAPAEAPGGAPAHVFGRVITAGGMPHRVALFSRQMTDITTAFPDVAEAAAAWAASGHSLFAGGAVLDAEIVPVERSEAAGIAGSDGADARILPFQVLQQRLGRRAPGADVTAALPVALVVYDVLVASGDVVYERPLHARRVLLDTLCGLPSTATALRVAPQQTATAADLDALFAAARARGNEGLMVKRIDAPYRPGTRGRDWLKVKRALATLDVVVTAAQVGHGKRRHLLSDLTFAVRASEASDAPLLNVGKAYSGLTDAELATLTAHLEATTLETFAHGRVRTVEPTVVLEVTFDAVQPSARHKGGYALRFPRIVRLRPDKTPADIDTIDEVARLATRDAGASGTSESTS